MYKKLVVALLVINLAIAALSISYYFQIQGINKDLLGKYILVQHNISEYLNNAVDAYNAGDNDSLIINLHYASGEFLAVEKIIAPGTSVGHHTNASELMYSIHSSQKNFIADFLEKALNEALSEKDISRLFSFAKAMDHYAGLLDYDEITSERSPRRIVSIIDDKLDQVSQLYTGDGFNQ